MPCAQAVARIFRLSWCISDMWLRSAFGGLAGSCVHALLTFQHTLHGALGRYCTQTHWQAATQTPCNYNRDYAYANGFPVVAKGLDMDIPMTSATNGNMSWGAGVWLLDGCVGLGRASWMCRHLGQSSTWNKYVCIQNVQSLCFIEITDSSL